MVLLAICSLHLVDDDARKFGSLPHQKRFLSYWLDSLVHERPVSNKLKGPVWEVQSLINALFTSFIVYTLEKEEREERERGEQQIQNKKRLASCRATRKKSSLWRFVFVSLSLHPERERERENSGQTHSSGPREGDFTAVHHPLNKGGFNWHWGLVLPLCKHFADV